MKLIAKAKPIRIRIKSGGEEHFSLDSLRNNLCVQDLWPLIQDKRLSRWLMQLGEAELAHAMDTFSESQLDFSSYFQVLSLFLKDDLIGQPITNLYNLFSFWHDSEEKDSKNYISLRKYLLNRYEGAKFIFKQYSEEVSDGKWWDIFSKFENEKDPDFLFAQGKLAFNGFQKSDGSNGKDIVHGSKLLETAAELHNQEAIDFVNSNNFGVVRKLAMLTPESKEKIEILINRWQNEMLGFSTRKTNNDEYIVREVKQLLQEFASLRKTYKMFNKRVLRDEAFSKYKDLDESDLFFKERKFVQELAQYSYNKKTPDLFVTLADVYHYPLAQYMLDRPVDNRKEKISFVVKSFNRKEEISFVVKSFDNQLLFVVKNLFKY